MGHILNEISHTQCTGCFLCQNVCNKKAIQLVLNKKGFYTPVVDEGICTNCGLCSKKCPAINDLRPLFNTEPRAYAAWNLDSVTIKKSSSGGIAFLIGKYVIENSGIVYGVKWNNGIPTFGKAETLNQLEDFRGSKYLQPIASDIYNDVKKSIKEGRKVLFIGLPCHIRALLNYVSSDNLITIDILCAGVPSQLLWNKYCKWKFGTQKVTSANFRSKELGWRISTIKFYSGNEEILVQPNYKNEFFLGFNSALFYNDACYKCRLNTTPRLGDITIGDFWGAPKDLDNKNGVSIILSNTSNGINIINSIRNKEIFIREIEFKDAIAGNYRINNAQRNIPQERDIALKILMEKGIKTCSNRYFKPETILTKIIRKIKRNL